MKQPSNLEAEKTA